MGTGGGLPHPPPTRIPTRPVQSHIMTGSAISAPSSLIQPLPPSSAPVISPAVDEVEYRARRAHVDDLPGLQALWQRVGLPWDQLERFLTEFIVVPDPEGTILAAVGLQTEGDEGLVHSEAVIPRDDEADLRSALWQRLQIVARNQGVSRLWTLEDDAFWQSVFAPAALPDIAASPIASADPEAPWTTLQLIDRARAQKLIDERMALWEASRQSDSSGLHDTIAQIRRFAFVLAGSVIFMMVLMIVYVLVRKPGAINTLLQHAR